MIKLWSFFYLGHSGQEGNDNADKAATWGQNDGGRNVENMRECMEWLEASTRAEQEDADAEAESDVGQEDADESRVWYAATSQRLGASRRICSY